MPGTPSATTGAGTSPSPTLSGHVRQIGGRAMQGLRAAGRTVVSLARWLVRTWRRSLQFRVVSTTVTLGIVVVTMLGSYLYSEIADGLRRERVATSEYEARTLTAQAQTRWENVTVTTGQELNIAARDLMTSTLAPAGPQPSRYVVMMRGSRNTSQTVLDPLGSGELGLASVSR